MPCESSGASGSLGSSRTRPGPAWKPDPDKTLVIYGRVVAVLMALENKNVFDLDTLSDSLVDSDSCNDTVSELKYAMKLIKEIITNV